VGTSRKSPFKPDEMGHFAGGSETLLSALADKICAAGGQIELSCAARKITIADGRLTVATDAGDLDADAAVMAIPLPVAAQLIENADADFAAALRQVPVIGVVCALVRMPRHLTPYFWLNINDERIAYNGLIEYSNLNPSGEAWGGEVLYIPFYLPADEDRFSWPDDKWRQLFIDGLGVIDERLAAETEVAAVTRDVYAQPICGVGFSERVPPIRTPLPGVFLVEASQLYPSDRCLSGMIGLATRAVEMATASR